VTGGDARGSCAPASHARAATRHQRPPYPAVPASLARAIVSRRTRAVRRGPSALARGAPPNNWGRYRAPHAGRLGPPLAAPAAHGAGSARAPARNLPSPSPPSPSRVTPRPRAQSALQQRRARPPPWPRAPRAPPQPLLARGSPQDPRAAPCCTAWAARARARPQGKRHASRLPSPSSHYASSPRA
jgi:hypothetical protein